MLKVSKISSVIVLFLLAFLAWFGVELSSAIPSSPEVAIELFYKRQVAEDQIMDPLILAGRAVVPILEKEVTNPEMPNRRYAIGALGNLSSRSSLPILKTLARMKTEEDYIRCDALAAIGMIDHIEGLRVVTMLKKEELSCLADVADDQGFMQWLKSNEPRRTYLKALLGWHS